MSIISSQLFMSQIYTSQLIISLEPPASAGAELGECQPWAGPGAKQTKIRNLMLSKVQEAFVNQPHPIAIAFHFHFFMSHSVIFYKYICILRESSL